MARYLLIIISQLSDPLFFVRIIQICGKLLIYCTIRSLLLSLCERPLYDIIDEALRQMSPFSLDALGHFVVIERKRQRRRRGILVDTSFDLLPIECVWVAEPVVQCRSAGAQPKCLVSFKVRLGRKCVKIAISRRKWFQTL
jgi:hypothetical protein